MSQSNTRIGDFSVAAAVDLTGMADRLVVLGNNAGVPVVNLPAANSDPAVYLLIDEAPTG